MDDREVQLLHSRKSFNMQVAGENRNAFRACSQKTNKSFYKVIAVALVHTPGSAKTRDAESIVAYMLAHCFCPQFETSRSDTCAHHCGQTKGAHRYINTGSQYKTIKTSHL